VTTPQTSAPDDELLVRTLTQMTYGFCGALLMVGLLGAFVLVPEPTVTPIGLLIGAVLALVSWFAPTVAIRRQLGIAARRGVAPGQARSAVQTAVLIGAALAEAPALLGLALAFVLAGGHDVAPFALSVPVAVASLWLNVSGPAAVRRHLGRARSTIAY
jgi:F0F1-type ATP synthase membrane subunit c/vacuolar-type H+-ATPase subunit K